MRNATDPAGVLTTFGEGWKTYQDLLITALAPLTPDQLALSVAPGQRTVEHLARHIIAARAIWLHRTLREGGDDLAALAAWNTWEPTEPWRYSAAELITGLQTTWCYIEQGLEGWTPADLAAQFSRTSEGETRTFSRLWVLWHLIEHDLHHGGELSFILGTHGLAAPDV